MIEETSQPTSATGIEPDSFHQPVAVANTATGFFVPKNDTSKPADAIIFERVSKISYEYSPNAEFAGIPRNRQPGEDLPDILQISEYALNRHFEAIHQNWLHDNVGFDENCNEIPNAAPYKFVKKLTQKRIKQGLQHPDKILGFRGEYNSMYVPVRGDLDCHFGENDLPAFREWFNQKLQFTPYHTNSTHGGSANFWLDRPANMTIVEANRIILDLDHALTALAIRDGFVEPNGRARCELHGSYLLTAQHHDDDGNPTAARKVVSMGRVKLPDGVKDFCNNHTYAKQPPARADEDKQAWLNATISLLDPRIRNVIHEGLPLWKEQQRAKAQAERERLERQAQRTRALEQAFNECDEPIQDQAKPKRRRNSDEISPVILEKMLTQDKPTSRHACVRAVVNMLPIMSKIQLLEMMDKVECDANTLYSNTVGTAASDNVHDAKRKRDIHNAFMHVYKTYDPSKKGTGSNSEWFDDPYEYSGDFEQLLHEHKQELVARGIKLDNVNPDICSVVYQTMRKNIDHPLRPKINGQSQVPFTACQGMLRYFQMRDNGNAVSTARRICQHFGYFIISDKSYQVGGRCQKWIKGPNVLVHHDNHANVNADHGGKHSTFLYTQQVCSPDSSITCTNSNMSYQDNHNYEHNNGESNVDSRWSAILARSRHGNVNLW